MNSYHIQTEEELKKSLSYISQPIYQPEFSEWNCHLFGAVPGSGVAWRPLKGKEPNWFWRKMQYIFFGNLWIKERN
jgi:hypothetical protein